MKAIEELIRRTRELPTIAALRDIAERLQSIRFGRAMNWRDVLLKAAQELEEGPKVRWVSTIEAMPDSDTTVLIHVPRGDDPVWMGFHDGEQWRYVDAMPVGKRVRYWAHLPEPPPL